MQRSYRALSAAAGLCSAVFPFAVGAEDSTAALDTVVVTATRTETPLSEVGNSITVISADEIAQRQVYSVADVLRGVPGVDVVSSGGLGKQTSVFLRGADSSHTLVLIDGVEMNDPSNTKNYFDFSQLLADDVERIEVLRGAASAMYGSDAIGGVIQIFTKKGGGKPRYSLRGEGGSYGTFRSSAAVSGGLDRWSYRLNASRLETDGFSVASQMFGNREKDGYRNTTVDARVGYQALENLAFDFTARYIGGHTREDGWSFAVQRPSDDRNAYSTSEQLYTRGQAKLDLLDGRWQQIMGIGYSRSERVSNNPYDAVNPFREFYTFNGYKLKGDWRHILKLHDTNTLTLGTETEEEWMDNGGYYADSWGLYPATVARHTANATSVYLQDQFNPWRFWHTTASVRYDHHNRFGQPITWRVAQVWELGDSGARVKGSYGTGYKAPTLYQLYAPPTAYGPIGNRNLNAERSVSWDAGVEQTLWNDQATLGATWFNNRFSNLIDFDFLVGYINRNRAHSEGVETYAELRPWSELSLRGAYTYTRTDGGTGRHGALLNRPNHKGSFDAHYRPLQDWDFNLNIQLVGRKDSYGGVAGGYTVVNLAASYQVLPQVKLFARADNLFDNAYQDIWGYGTSRLAGYGGVEMDF